MCSSDLPRPSDLREVTLGTNGAFAGMTKGAVFVDHTTASAEIARELDAAAKKIGFGFVDAPVSGGSEGARNATLTIFVGGDASDVERARPVLDAIGRTITHVGPIGAGQAVKAVNQVILAGTYLGVAEGIVLAIKAGLDVEQVVEEDRKSVV